MLCYGNNIVISSLFHRWMTLLSISLAIVFVVLLTLLSLISGALGSSPSDTPSTRSDTSNCAGRALMWYANTILMDCFQYNITCDVHVKTTLMTIKVK